MSSGSSRSLLAERTDGRCEAELEGLLGAFWLLQNSTGSIRSCSSLDGKLSILLSCWW